MGTTSRATGTTGVCVAVDGVGRRAFSATALAATDRCEQVEVRTVLTIQVSACMPPLSAAARTIASG